MRPAKHNNKMKERYTEFAKQYDQIPIFMQPWWLDTVCGKDNWDVILIEKNGKIQAAWPLFFSVSKSLKIITNPKLSPHLGPLLIYPKGLKYQARLSFEKKAFEQLINLLPKYDYLKIGFDYQIKNWLPFYWKSFSQSTHFSYIIKDTSNLEMIKSGLQDNTRRQINKPKIQVSLKTTDNIELLYNLTKKTFERQNRNTPYSLAFIKDLHQIAHSNNQCEIVYALDSEDRIHSSALFVWDHESVYYLVGGSDPEHRNSGAMSLVIWEGIKLASEKGLQFDFEGSMIEPIERFFRSFGATQVPYFSLSKVGNRKTEILFLLKSLLTGKKF